MSDTESKSQAGLSGGASANSSTWIAPKVTALHPKIADALPLFLNEAKARGLYAGVHMGIRTADEQEALYAKGRTAPGGVVTNARGWESWHCYGLAVDVVFKDEKGNWTWSEKYDWDGLGAVGKMFGFVWGGDWTKFPDRPHFQMTGRIPNVREAKRILFAEGIEGVWKLV